MDQRSVGTTAKWCALAALPIAVLCVVESLTGWQSYNMLQVHCPWREVSETLLNPRSGFYRAVGPFSHPIQCGAVFFVVLPFAYSLRHENGRWRKASLPILVVIAAGVLSSMSSGPVSMMLTLGLCLILQWFRYLVKPLLAFLAVACIAIEILSNRSFYRVLTVYMNPLGGAGWHRSRIIELAIERVGEWWLAGYGGRDPGWGPSLGAIWTDITNTFVAAGVESGLLGVVALCGVLTSSLCVTIRLYRSARGPAMRSWYWALGSTVVTFVIGFNAILFSGQAATLFYCLMGCIGAVDNIARKDYVSRFRPSEKAKACMISR